MEKNWSAFGNFFFSCCFLFCLFVYFIKEHIEPWRKSTIFFSSCCSSETAEWVKHVWSSDLLRTISTPHTFLPSVCLFCPALHRTLTGLCTNFAECWHFFLLLFRCSRLPRIHVCTGCLIYFSFSIFFFSIFFFCLFPAPPPHPLLLPRSHSSQKEAHRRSTHPHSCLLFLKKKNISAFPEEKLTSLACAFIPL